jgi:hypothetical protein
MEKKPLAVMKTAVAAAALEEDGILGSARWSNAEKTKLFEWLLGADSEEQDVRFNKHKKNPGRMYKKVGFI